MCSLEKDKVWILLYAHVMFSSCSPDHLITAHKSDILWLNQLSDMFVLHERFFKGAVKFEVNDAEILKYFIPILVQAPKNTESYISHNATAPNETLPVW